MSSSTVQKYPIRTRQGRNDSRTVEENKASKKQSDEQSYTTNSVCFLHNPTALDKCLSLKLQKQGQRAKPSLYYTAFQFLKKLWYCVGGRVKQKFGFIKRVDYKG